jgi:hypothetical protein
MLNSFGRETVKYQDSFKWFDELYELDSKVKHHSLQCMAYADYKKVYIFYHCLKELYDHVCNYIGDKEGKHKKLDKIEVQIDSTMEEVKMYMKRKAKNQVLTKLGKLKPLLREYKRILYIEMKKHSLLALTYRKLEAGDAMKMME